jgi:CBS domain containing-hemolysin-like protein
MRLREVTVDDVKTPRVVVFALNRTTTVGEFLDAHAEIPFSRIPIFENTLDDITGFVLKGDLLLSAARGETGRELCEFEREVILVNDFARLPDTFKTLTENRHHVAIVLDEFGGMSGLLTMEDIVETLLGLEIVDEVDTREDMRAFARSLWEKRGGTMGFELEAPEREANSGKQDGITR